MNATRSVGARRARAIEERKNRKRQNRWVSNKAPGRHDHADLLHEISERLAAFLEDSAITQVSCGHVSTTGGTQEARS